MNSETVKEFKVSGILLLADEEGETTDIEVKNFTVFAATPKEAVSKVRLFYRNRMGVNFATFKKYNCELA